MRRKDESLVRNKFAPAIQKILACFGLPSRAPPIAPAKPDVEEEFF
jgi:hypothetical protein